MKPSRLLYSRICLCFNLRIRIRSVDAFREAGNKREPTRLDSARSQACGVACVYAHSGEVHGYVHLTRFDGGVMPLPDYGVLVGTLNRFTRDDPNDFGSWYHGKLYIQAPAGEYECVVDVSTPSGVPVQYREVRRLDRSLFVPADMDNGWHTLSRTPVSGALDYVRSPLLRHKRTLSAKVSRPIIDALNSLIRSPHLGWVESTADNALDLLESRLCASRRVFAYGAPYTSGRGVHDIHMNQGDPPGQFQHLDGIWQDGGTIIESKTGVLDAFLTKFKPQSFYTDKQGLPI